MATADTHMIVQPKISERQQILSALRMVGSAFEAQGGAALMLTEAVENGVDAIIDGRKQGYTTGEIRVFIDNVGKRVVIADNGTGFLKVHKAIELPYTSVKEHDPDQTGKWGRGLQGFRAFCDSLEFVTRRTHVPEGEDIVEGDRSADGKTIRINFIEDDIDIKLARVNDDVFGRWFALFDNAEPYAHGTVAVYEHWRKGQFEKLRKEDVIRRIEHHFGEEIRKGKIKIIVEVYEGKIGALDKARSTLCLPKDYSPFKLLDVKSMPYMVDGKEKGRVNFHLFLSERGRKDRWEFPFLLHEDRPVGDTFIIDLDDFRDNPIWESQYLTCYITCDFCSINETRTALKKGDELEFLYAAIHKAEPTIEGHIKKHAKGLYDLRLHKQINEMVVKLQKFLKNKHVFEFRIARSTGILTQEEQEIEIVQVVTTEGVDTSKEVADPEGTGTALDGSITVLPDAVVQEASTSGAYTSQQEIGGHGENAAASKDGGPDAPATSTDSEQPNDNGYTETPQGLQKPAPQDAPMSPGGEGESTKTGKRPRPRGFGVRTQNDEFNPEPSSFDGVNSLIIINTGHPRYSARANEDTRSKELLDYIAELYLWEIAKLAKKSATAPELGSFFLDLKFEYFEREAKEKPKATAEASTS